MAEDVPSETGAGPAEDSLSETGEVRAAAVTDPVSAAARESEADGRSKMGPESSGQRASTTGEKLQHFE